MAKKKTKKTARTKLKPTAKKKAGAKKAINAGKAVSPLRYITAVIKFLRNAIAELKTVTWLSRKDTVKFSLYVIAFIIFSALTIALIDFGLIKLVSFITTS